MVEVTALAGPSRDGQLTSPARVGFSAANTGSATYADPTRLDRYLDPEHGRALASLAAANAAAQARTEADQERRLALGCLNLFRLGSPSPARCGCVYCTPAEHEHAARLAEAGLPDPLSPDRCICAQTVPSPASRCPRHVDHDLVVLDGESDALRRLARLTRRLEPPTPGEQTPRSDGPDLSPGGP